MADGDTQNIPKIYVLCIFVLGKELELEPRLTFVNMAEINMLRMSFLALQVVYHRAFHLERVRHG